MKDVIKYVIVLCLFLALFTLAMMDVILGETLIVSLAVLFITYYSFKFIDGGD